VGGLKGKKRVLKRLRIRRVELGSIEPGTSLPKGEIEASADRMEAKERRLTRP